MTSLDLAPIEPLNVPALDVSALPTIAQDEATACLPLIDAAISTSDALKQNNSSEQDRLFAEHLPLVRVTARHIHERLPRHVELDDLISAGILGLMDALSKFDSDKQVRFRSYAQFRIQGAILDSLRSLDWGSRGLRRKGRAVEEAIRILTQQLDRAPLDGEIADRMGIALTDYQNLLSDLNGLEIGSLHVERTGELGEEELAYLAGSDDDNPLFIAMKGEIRQHLIDAIRQLPPRECKIVFLYYFEELTMTEIARTMGMAISRVSQLHASSVLRLRSAMLSTGTSTDSSETWFHSLGLACDAQ